jgi:hypothetical protein
MTSATGFDPDPTRIEWFEERYYLCTSQGPIERDTATVSNAVNLKNVLGEI